MAHVTEAACLLDSGVVYGSRVLLRPPTGAPVFAGFKAGVFSLYCGDAPVFHFDLEGRWQKVFLDGRHCLKGLDTRVQAIERSRQGTSLILTRRALPYAEASDLDALVRATALDLAADLDAGRYERLDPPPTARPLALEDLRAFLEAATRWDAAAWFAHRARYLDTYGPLPLPLLPPDCTNPLVLQATLGDESGRTFGSAPACRFHARTPTEFATHTGDVAKLFGRRIVQCRQVFLAGADALRRPLDEVAGYLDLASRTFPVEPGLGPRRPDTGEDVQPRLDGVHAFLDRFDPPLPDRKGWTELRSRGLTRVSLGIESGDPAVRARFGKSWTNEVLVSLVANLEAAAIGVTVILLVGAGGVEHDDDRQAEATADLLLTLPLGAGDLVSLLGASDLPGPDHLTPLAPVARAVRFADLRARLAPLKDRKVRVAPWSMDRQTAL